MDIASLPDPIFLWKFITAFGFMIALEGPFGSGFYIDSRKFISSLMRIWARSGLVAKARTRARPTAMTGIRRMQDFGQSMAYILIDRIDQIMEPYSQN
jgi:hypothetical protein